jgi:hypothetical protein
MKLNKSMLVIRKTNDLSGLQSAGDPKIQLTPEEIRALSEIAKQVLHERNELSVNNSDFRAFANRLVRFLKFMTPIAKLIKEYPDKESLINHLKKSEKYDSLVTMIIKSSGNPFSNFDDAYKYLLDLHYDDFNFFLRTIQFLNRVSKFIIDNKIKDFNALLLYLRKNCNQSKLEGPNKEVHNDIVKFLHRHNNCDYRDLMSFYMNYFSLDENCIDPRNGERLISSVFAHGDETILESAGFLDAKTLLLGDNSTSELRLDKYNLSMMSLTNQEPLLVYGPVNNQVGAFVSEYSRLRSENVEELDLAAADISDASRIYVEIMDIVESLKKECKEQNTVLHIKNLGKVFSKKVNANIKKIVSNALFQLSKVRNLEIICSLDNLDDVDIESIRKLSLKSISLINNEDDIKAIVKSLLKDIPHYESAESNQELIRRLTNFNMIDITRIFDRVKKVFYENQDLDGISANDILKVMEDFSEDQSIQEFRTAFQP